MPHDFTNVPAASLQDAVASLSAGDIALMPAEALRAPITVTKPHVVLDFQGQTISSAGGYVGRQIAVGEPVGVVSPAALPPGGGFVVGNGHHISAVGSPFDRGTPSGQWPAQTTFSLAFAELDGSAPRPGYLGGCYVAPGWPNVYGLFVQQTSSGSPQVCLLYQPDGPPGTPMAKAYAPLVPPPNAGGPWTAVVTAPARMASNGHVPFKLGFSGQTCFDSGVYGPHPRVWYSFAVGSVNPAGAFVPAATMNLGKPSVVNGNLLPIVFSPNTAYDYAVVETTAPIQSQGTQTVEGVVIRNVRLNGSIWGHCLQIGSTAGLMIDNLVGANGCRIVSSSPRGTCWETTIHNLVASEYADCGLSLTSHWQATVNGYRAGFPGAAALRLAGCRATVRDMAMRPWRDTHQPATCAVKIEGWDCWHDYSFERCGFDIEEYPETVNCLMDIGQGIGCKSKVTVSGTDYAMLPSASAVFRLHGHNGSRSATLKTGDISTNAPVLVYDISDGPAWTVTT